jgi:hypothetical protein
MTPHGVAAGFALGVVMAFGAASSASAQFLPPTIVLDSFESGIDNWAAITDPANNVYLNHAASTTGVVHGAGSMLVDLYGTSQAFAADPRGGATGWAVTTTANSTDADLTRYNAFNTVAADPSKWNLQIDLTLDATSWATVMAQTSGPPAQRGAWSFLSLGLSSGAGGVNSFAQVAPMSPNIFNVQGKLRLRVPMDSLAANNAWTPNSDYFQFLLGANNKFIPQLGTAVGPPPSGSAAKIYIDNLRFKPKAPVVPNTLFSWETGLEGWSDAGLNEPVTVDDPMTPEDDRTPGDAYAHKHTVGPIGATHGAQALTIDTSIQDPTYVNPLGLPQNYAFHWGSNMTLNSDTDPGEPEVIDPAIQARITDLATKINKAQAIAFDVTFSDPLLTGANPTAALPTFLGFALHISDERGTFFQADSAAFDGATISNLLIADDPSEPITITLPISLFTDKGANNLGPLATTKLQADSTFLRMGLAVNADGPAVIRLDNFRVLIETSLDADFDNNGKVNAADLAVWRSAYGVNANGDANDDGVTDGADFLLWQRQLGNDATVGSTSLATGVPEPAGGAMIACVAAALAATQRRKAAC